MQKTNLRKKARHIDNMVELYLGDCLDVLDKIPENSVDLYCSDPPYRVGILGQGWDQEQDFTPIWRKVLQVLKPGAFAYILCGARQDCLWRTIMELSLAGFKIDFSPFFWTYADGYPKGYNVGKALKKKGQADPRFEGAYAGCQPKPAVEVILVAMKPLAEKTFEAQAKANGHGITRMDDCRILYRNRSDYDACAKKQKSFHGAKTIGTMTKGNTTFLNGDIKVLPPKASQGGRFPANLLVSDGILDTDTRRNSPAHNYSRYFSLDAWAEYNLPFLIVPKPSKHERNLGLDGANPHPTMKPIDIMCYLITMGSRPGDKVLDCFSGSGTTGIAARKLGRRFIGIERDPVYFEAAKRRMDAWKTKTV
jgi:site-specific DNA-methyltransferase (adenine-specific)